MNLWWGQTVENTEIFVYRCHAMDKGEVLARILQAEGRGLTMVFCRTKRTCDKVAEDMSERQVAETLGISTGSVKTHAFRGLARLRATGHPDQTGAEEVRP